MKKIILKSISLAAIISYGIVSAQIAFGKDNVTNGSVLLEFGSDNKGIILPSVASVSGTAGGTFVFDTTIKAVEVWEGKNNNNSGGWTFLTDANQGILHSFSNAGTDVVSSGPIIGAPNSVRQGALVLESVTKAMVLPYVEEPHLTMKGTIAGTIVYDTVSDTLAVYDGANWSYWK